MSDARIPSRTSAAIVLKRATLFALAAALLTLGSSAQAPSPAPDQILKSIQDLIQTGDLAGARTRLTAALKDYPGEPVLYNFLGVLEAQRGKYREAESGFRKAVELAPGFAGAYLNLGRLYQENVAKDDKAIEKGIATYRALLRLDPASVEANYQIAVLLTTQGSFRQALEHLGSLPVEVQDRAQALSVRCAAEAGLGDVPKAERTAQQLLNSADLSEADVVLVLPTLAKLNQDRLAIRLLEGLTERRLASHESLRHLAALYEKLDQLEQARKTYERAAGPGTITPSLLIDLARVAYKQTDWEGALSYLAHARDLEPENAGIHFFFGMVSIEMDLPVEAEKSLRAAIELNSENPYYNYALGAVLASSRKWKESIPYFEKYCAGKPGDPRGKLALASARFHSFELDLARKELMEVVKKPETAAGAHYHLGLMAIQENNFPEAIQELEAAVKINPEYADAYAELGFAHMQMEEYDKARKALERSVELHPEGRRANMVLLSLYQRTEDPRAEEQVKRFEELDKELAERAKMLLRTIEARPY